MTSPLSVTLFVRTEQTEDPCTTCGAEQRRGQPSFLHFFSRTSKEAASRCINCVEALIEEFRTLAMVDPAPARHTLKRELEAHYEATRGGSVNPETGEAEPMAFEPLREHMRAQREAERAAETSSPQTTPAPEPEPTTEPPTPPPPADQPDPAPAVESASKDDAEEIGEAALDAVGSVTTADVVPQPVDGGPEAEPTPAPSDDLAPDVSASESNADVPVPAPAPG